MRVTVYMIGNGPDLPVGTAVDIVTLLSLIELASLKERTGVSLHGQMPDGQVVSGEMSLRAANELAMSQPVA